MSSNPPLPPITGSIIQYYHWPTRSTQKAKLEKTFKTMQTKYPGWFNITNEGANIITSLNLFLTKWTYLPYLSPIHQAAEIQDDEEIYQVDGNYTLPPPPDHSLPKEITESADNSLDWDDYASDPSFTLPPSDSSVISNISERAQRRSQRERTKSSKTSEKVCSPSYSLRPRKQPQFFNVHNLDISSDDTANDVFELTHENYPPPLPPRSQRSLSVIICSKETCKPRDKSHFQ